jgi:hypothetical protein
MTIRLLLLMALLVASPAWAATTYIDPSCTYDGDGTVGDPCAASASAVGPRNVWPAGPGITGADAFFLQKAGTTYLFQVTVDSGTAGHPVTVGAYGAGAKPIIRSEEHQLSGSIKIATNAHDIVIDGLEVHGQRNLSDGEQANAIRNNATNDSTVVNITVRNCTIGPVHGFGPVPADDDGVDLRGQGLLVEDNTFYDISNDAVWLDSAGTANDVIIRRNTCALVSTETANGDCYQVSGTSTGMLIEDNYCDHSNVDTKNCIVANADTNIFGNEVHGFVGGTTQIGIYCDVGPCRIARNRSYYGKVGIANYSTTGGYTVANIVTTPATYGIEVAAPASPVYNNTVDGVGTGYAAIRLTSAATNSVARNNIVSDTDEGIRLTSGSGQSESYNMFHGTVATRVYNTTTAGSISATNPVNATAQFVNEVAGNYRTKGNSTARRAGTPVPSCQDYRGRVCQSPPDIGAFQTSSGDQPNTRAVRIVP